MLLKAMDDLLKMTDWKWDFFINLSESDYPVKYIVYILYHISYIDMLTLVANLNIGLQVYITFLYLSVIY